MIIAGKCPPESEELEAAKNRGFDKVELYVERKHLDHMQDTVQNIRESDVEVVSVHTPHVHIDGDKGYFLLADQLACKLGAYLVFHSQYMHLTHLPQIEELDIEAEHGYENNPGISRSMLENNILKKDHELVLDTAHFFMSGPESHADKIDDIIKAYHNQINLIHLCDSTTTKDGLPFGDGEMNMEAVCQTIKESNFNGILVLEVMPEHQEDAKKKWVRYTDQN